MDWPNYFKIIKIIIVHITLKQTEARCMSFFAFFSKPTFGDLLPFDKAGHNCPRTLGGNVRGVNV